MDAQRRFSQAYKQAVRLVEQTKDLIQLAKESAHQTRNTRQHSLLLRTIGKIIRKARTT